MAKKTTPSSSKTAPKTSKAPAPKKPAASKRPPPVPPEGQEISDEAFLAASLPPQVDEVLPILINHLAPWYGSKAASSAANLWALYGLTHPLKFRNPEPQAAAFAHAYLQSFSKEPPSLEEVADEFEVSPASFRSLLPAFSAFLARHSERKLTRFSVSTLGEIAIEQKKPLSDLRSVLISLFPPSSSGKSLPLPPVGFRPPHNTLLLFEKGRFFAFALPPHGEEDFGDEEIDPFGEAEDFGEDESPFWGLYDFLDEAQIEKLIAVEEKAAEPSSIRHVPAFDLGEDFSPLQPLPLGNLLLLPQSSEIWIGGLCAAPANLQDAGSSYLFVWADAETGIPLIVLPFRDDLPKEAVLMGLAAAMASPSHGQPRRPRSLRLLNPSWVPSFRTIFLPFEIQSRHANKEDIRIFEESALLLSRYPPSYTDSEEALLPALQALPSALVTAFFQTTAALVENEFFLVILEDQIVQVDFQSWGYPAYTVSSIGEAAESIGLLCFSSLRDFLCFRQTALEGHPSRLSSLDLSFVSLNYTPLEMMPPSIRKEQKRKKWKLSKEKLFPSLDLFQMAQLPKTATLAQYEQAIAIAEAFQFLIDKHTDLFQTETPPKPQTLHFQSPTFSDRPPIVLRIPHPALLDPDLDETPVLPAARPSRGSSFEA